ncbi:MAG: hypothetical protein WA810_03020, partial [Maribacter sp.]
VALLTLSLLNMYLPLVDMDIFVYAILGVLVFGFFNFRRKALFFAGDIGSIAIGVYLIYFILFFCFKVSSLLPLLFITVYFVDGGMTILTRLAKKENVFKPHRSHLYQKLTNSGSLTHLQVAGLYAGMQSIINVLALYFILKRPELELFVVPVVLFITIFVYVFGQRKITSKEGLS